MEKQCRAVARCIENGDFRCIAREYLTDDMVKYITRNPDCGISLSDISCGLNRLDKTAFLRKIFPLRREISSRELAAIYVDALNSNNDFFEQAVMQENSVNIEHSHKVTGCQSIIFPADFDLPPGILHALSSDSVPEFAIYETMTSCGAEFDLLPQIVKYTAGNILEYLIRKQLVSDDDIDWLLAYTVQHRSADVGRKLLSAIEKARPGTLKNFTDAYNRNLLWFTLYHGADSSLAELLLDYGCDHGNKNVLGLTWEYCSKVKLPKKFIIPFLSMYHNRTFYQFTEKWDSFWTAESALDLPVIKQLTRPANDKAIYKEVQNILANGLKNTVEDFSVDPASVLPSSWQNNIVLADGKQFLLQIPNSKTGGCCKVEKLSDALKIMQSGLLIYNPLVRNKLIQSMGKYGPYSMLRFLNTENCRTELPPEILQSIELDNAEMFAAAHKTGRNGIFSDELLKLILGGKKVNITAYLLDSAPYFHEPPPGIIPRAYYPVEALVFYAASQLDDASGTIFLQALAKRHPEVIGQSTDRFGSNALYYTVFNKNIKWYAPDCKLVNFLKKSGCSEHMINDFGIAFIDLVQGHKDLVN